MVSGVIARSLTETEQSVTLPQLRVLVLTGDRGSLTLGEVADLLAVHPSNATRLVDRLVQGGLLGRRDDPSDRRQLQLTLTSAGEALLSKLLGHRREQFRRLLQRLSPDQQTALGRSMRALADAGQGDTDESTWVVPYNSKPS